MSTKIVTEEAFLKAVASLEAKDIEVNYDTLRTAMKGGSFSTMKPLFEAYTDRKRFPTQPTPETVENRAKAFVQELWSTAVTEATIEIGRVKSDAKDQMDRMSKDLLVSNAEIKRLEASQDDLEAQIALLQDQAAELRVLARQVDDLKLQLASAHDETNLHRTNAETEARSAAELRGEVRTLREQPKRMRPSKSRAEPLLIADPKHQSMTPSDFFSAGTSVTVSYQSSVWRRSTRKFILKNAG
ncbi:MAG: DNA-binding protein [Gallionella sp.]|nr:DNA-binding protein [Gallionella sp.]